MTSPEVLVLATGGTIDKIYHDAKSAYEIGDPQSDDIFQRAGVTFTYAVETILSKDSLDFTDADRETVARAAVGSASRCVMVTHGTDTMAETARVVAGALREAGSGQTVVFVGSLAPARFRETDAEFNVGFAAAAVQILPPGCYIAMSGRVFDPFAVRKNRDANRFEALPPADDDLQNSNNSLTGT